MINTSYTTQLTRQMIEGHSHPSVDMVSRKPAKNKSFKRPAEWSRPNKKAQARLALRQKSVPITKSGNQESFTKPGSLNPKRGV